MARLSGALRTTVTAGAAEIRAVWPKLWTNWLAAEHMNYTQGGHYHRTVLRVPAVAVTDPASGRTMKVPLRELAGDPLAA